MLNEKAARTLLADIESARLAAEVLRNGDLNGDHVRTLSLVHTKLDEARLWLQDAIGYERG